MYGSVEPRLLLEREAELAQIEGCLRRAARGHGSALVVDGPAGIGKTALLNHVAGLAVALGFDALRARGLELEHAYAFGVARQLLERRLREANTLEHKELTAGPAVDAPRSLGMLDADGESDAGLRALHSLYWLTSNLAARRPLLLVVDDAHWCDAPSLRWLAYVAMRLDGVRLLLVLACRPNEPGAEQALLDVLVLDEQTVVLRPAALSPAAASTLVAATLGDGTDADLSGTCHRISGGNPLLLSALLHDLKNSGSQSAMAVELGSATVGRLVERRLRGLQHPGAIAVAEGVAVLADGVSVDQAARVVDMARSEVVEAVAELTAVDVLTTTVEGLSFVHPLVRAVVLQRIAPTRRAELHLRAAEDLAASHAGTERIALHLLHTDPAGSMRVVKILRGAAEDAAARGAPEVAREFLRRALREPPAPGAASVNVLCDLGVAEAATLDAEASDAHLRAGLAEAKANAPLLIGESALKLARTLGARAQFQTAIEALAYALNDVGPGSATAAELEATLLGQAVSDVQLRSHAQDLIDRRLAELDAGAALESGLLAVLSGLLIDHPPASRAAQVARAALTGGGDWEEPTVTWHVVNALVADGDYGGAQRVLFGVAERERRRGSALGLAWTDYFLAEVHYRAGDVIAAEAAARSVHDVLAGISGAAFDDIGRLWLAAALIRPLVARGHLHEADDIVRNAPGVRVGSHASERFVSARAELRHAQGRTDDAIADLQIVAKLFDRDEFPNPHQNGWRGRLAAVLVSVGERTEAVELAESELVDARRYGAAVTTGVSLVACGLAHGGRRGVRYLEEAVSLLCATEARLEHARALVHLGGVLRRSGERIAARDPLRAGMDLAQQCGATAVADLAHAELVTAGARPRRDRRRLSGPESLTAGEHRVAGLAAAGLTDREIAQQLYVTQAAVQWHLRNVFRKLGIFARAEISAALTDGAKT